MAASGASGGAAGSCSAPGRDGAAREGDHFHSLLSCKLHTRKSISSIQFCCHGWNHWNAGYIYTGDINNVWNHGIRVGSQGFKCLSCERTYGGGGATRLMEHLAAMGKQVRPCDRIPKEVRAAMRKKRVGQQEKRREETERNIRFERELVQEMI